MLPLLELVSGVVLAVVLFRLGMPSIFPLFIWVPLLSFSPSWLFIIGLVSASLAWEARGVIVSSSLIPMDWLIGFFIAGIGLLGIVFFHDLIPTLTLLIVPVLSVSLLFLLFRSTHPFFPFLIGVGFVLFSGWFGLHAWVVPFALPALLLGFFGSIPIENGSPSAREDSRPIPNAVLGVFSGLLPGIGPGIVGALWFSGHSSPALRVSNLVFSLGFVSITGSVRSYPAGVLSSFSLPSWEWLIAYSFIGFLLAYGICFLFSFSLSVPFVFFFLLHAVVLVLLGGIATLGLIFLSFCVSRLLIRFRLPLSLCSLCLIPSILWFYY